MLAYVATSSPLLSKGVTIFINMSGTDQMQFFFLEIGRLRESKQITVRTFNMHYINLESSDSNLFEFTQPPNFQSQTY